MWYTLKWQQQQYQKPEKVAGSITNILMGGRGSRRQHKKNLHGVGYIWSLPQNGNIQQWTQDWTMNVQN